MHFFFTTNPIIADFKLALRLAIPIKDNWTDTTGSHFIVPEDYNERKRMLEECSVAAAHTYMMYNNSVTDHMIGMNFQSSSTKAPLPQNIGIKGPLRKTWSFGWSHINDDNT